MKSSQGKQRRFSRGLRRMLLTAGVGAAALALAAAGCASSTNSTPTGATPLKGGTATFALPPSIVPDYIFPYVNSANITNINMFNLQALLYRPLYWFGNGDKPTVNPSLSLAYLPQVSGQMVTIKLKHYMWSNGTPVTAQDVMFWLNMELAVPQDYGAYTGFPANATNIKVVSPTELTMTMKKLYSPTWLLYNDLSQITPMPAAWDRTASGPSNCATTVKDCAAVYNYLNDQAKDMTGYVTSPIWSIVDGPWRLSAFSSDGHVTFVPNKSYSGPVKPKLAAFQEVPFTTDAAEYNVLRAPASSTKVDVGYLPEQDAPRVPAGKTVGANPLSGYTLSPLYAWAINYYVVNLQSTTGNGPVIRQLYFRQALAYLLNQAAIIKGPLSGYGVPTVGPVPNTPATSFLSPKGKAGNPFPYNPAKAKSLLTSHGWKVVPNGVSTCIDAAKCGPGVKTGQSLSLNFMFETGVSWVTSMMDQLQSAASLVGIKLNLEPKPANDVLAVAAGNCVATKVPCNWDMANWGNGWSFAPDYLPTGEDLFLCGAVANSGGYCNKTNDSMIGETLTSGNLSYMYSWQDYLATQLPLMWQPNAPYQLTEVASNLKGVLPLSSTLSITPESWYFVK